MFAFLLITVKVLVIAFEVKVLTVNVIPNVIAKFPMEELRRKFIIKSEER